MIVILVGSENYYKRHAGDDADDPYQPNTMDGWSVSFLRLAVVGYLHLFLSLDLIHFK